jgi:hypothetical protein
MEEHDDAYPLSMLDGQIWVQRFEQFASERGGVWTEKVNDAYKFCFGVDLVQMGNMSIGSQLDAYYTVESFCFDTNLVSTNFNLLPKPDKAMRIPCNDGAVAKGTAQLLSRKHKPDGGVKHYYVPITRCCGNQYCKAGDHLGKLQCAACKSVSYCGKDCQSEDWKLRHKKECKVLVTRS